MTFRFFNQMGLSTHNISWSGCHLDEIGDTTFGVILPQRLSLISTLLRLTTSCWIGKIKLYLLDMVLSNVFTVLC